MTGRQETNRKIEAKTLSYIEGKPILADYYYSLESKTARSREAYVRYVKNYFDYLENQGTEINAYDSFAAINVTDVNRYLATTKYYIDNHGNEQESGESIRNARLYAIKSFFRFLVVTRKISSSPAENAKVPADNKERKVVYLSDDETEIVQDAIKARDTKNYDDELRARDRAIFTLGIKTGLRESAIVEINLEDIDWDENKITVVEKGNVTRDVYFGTETRKALGEWIVVRKKYAPDDCDALFVSRRHRRISTDAVRALIKEAAKGTGKHITPHKMRSTTAVNLYEKTGDIYLVADTLGQKNIQNTRRYAMNTEKRRRHAASILDP